MWTRSLVLPVGEGGASSSPLLRRRLALLLLIAGALLGSSASARAEELSERAQRWASEVDFAGSLELRRGAQTLVRIDRFPEQPPAEPVFWIGSVSKQFTAAAVLRLVERGQLALARPIASYLPQLGSPALSRGGRSCTLEHVLSHSCGLPRGLGADFMDTARHLSDPARAERLLQQLARAQLLFEPGTQYSYSNAGYALLGLLIQSVSGQSYEAFLQTELWGPLGMRATGVAPRPGVDPVRGQLRLGPFWLDATRWMLLNPWAPSTVGAGGNIYSTLSDLLIWNDALHHGRVLSPELYRAMITPRHGDYGLGLVIRKRPFGTHIAHAGSHSPQSVSAAVAYVPEHDLSLVAGAPRTFDDSGLKPLGDALLAAATHSEPVPSPGAPGTGVVLLSSLLALLQLCFAGAALYNSWHCHRQRARYDRLTWWLRYHTPLFVVLAFNLRWRDEPFDPLIVVWGAWCLSVAWASRWWALPPWTRGPGAKKLARLGSQVFILGVVFHFLPARYLDTVLAVLFVELLPFAVRLLRAQRAPGTLSAAR